MTYGTGLVLLVCLVTWPHVGSSTLPEEKPRVQIDNSIYKLLSHIGNIRECSTLRISQYLQIKTFLWNCVMLSLVDDVSHRYKAMFKDGYRPGTLSLELLGLLQLCFS